MPRPRKPRRPKPPSEAELVKCIETIARAAPRASRVVVFGTGSVYLSKDFQGLLVDKYMLRAGNKLVALIVAEVKDTEEETKQEKNI